MHLNNIFIILSLFCMCYGKPYKSCVTPSNQEGTCRIIMACPVLMGIATKTFISKKEIYYLRKSACGFQSSIPKVCCPNPSSCQSTAFPPEPWTGCCGQPTFNNREPVRHFPAIGAYPWMTLLEYRYRNKTKLSCSAILLSGRYVLSAAQCMVDKKYGEPVKVRVGEFDIHNDGPDCVEERRGDIACNPGARSIPIEKIMVHPEYRSRVQRHDIALIRMAETVSYSDFISPICLPTSDLTLQSLGPFDLRIAGWGAINETHVYSYFLNHVDLPYMNFEECKRKYNENRREAVVHVGQICAGGNGADACRGDSGGPLMVVNGHSTEVAGIVSFGPSPCALKGIPGVYTDVFVYNAWIRKNIKE